jgi:acetate kinase
LTTPNGLLVFNVGSSSLKAELFVPDEGWRSSARVVLEEVGTEHSVVRISGQEPEPVSGVANHEAAAELVLERLCGRIPGGVRSIAATAHRVVHGGDEFFAPVVVTDAVLTRLSSLNELAPLHNPPALAVMRAIRTRLPGVPMAAVFDTAFFRDLPEHARVYAIPHDWRRSYGIRRYGFHGIAHAYLHSRHRALTRRRTVPTRVVTLQLGQGCSAAALLDGRAVETSMGYTPLEGLVMGTRPGDLDAGVLLRLMRCGVGVDALEQALNRESGLLGLSQSSSDMRELVEREAAGDPQAALALDVFCHRVRKYIGAYAAILGGLEAVLFGGGIGENAPAIRARICAGLEWLGLDLDPNANAACVGAELSISAAASAVEVYVIRVHEEEAIARAAHARLADAQS